MGSLGFDAFCPVPMLMPFISRLNIARPVTMIHRIEPGPNRVCETQEICTGAWCSRNQWGVSRCGSPVRIAGALEVRGDLALDRQDGREPDGTGERR
jgi:hypothetical protein